MGKKKLTDAQRAKQINDEAMARQPYGNVARVKTRKDSDGSFVTEYYKTNKDKEPFATDTVSRSKGGKISGHNRLY